MNFKFSFLAGEATKNLTALAFLSEKLKEKKGLIDLFVCPQVQTSGVSFHAGKKNRSPINEPAQG